MNSKDFSVQIYYLDKIKLNNILVKLVFLNGIC